MTRRSAGMRGDPRAPCPELEISTVPPPRREAPEAAAPISRSRHPRPAVLMGEVAMPKAGAPHGPESGAGREAFRAFMRRRRLAPTQWAKDAGVPVGEVLAYLTGRTRHLSAETAAKLANIAGVAPEAMFAE